MYRAFHVLCLFCESTNRPNNYLHPVSGPALPASYFTQPFFVADPPQVIVCVSSSASLKAALSDLEPYPPDYARHYNYDPSSPPAVRLYPQHPAYSPVYTTECIS